MKLTQSARKVACYDPIEITLTYRNPCPVNPFTHVAMTGSFQDVAGVSTVVDGFCDSPDGTVYRIRFMPRTTGKHRYTVMIKGGGTERKFKGEFAVGPAKLPGPVRTDPDHPWHFVREGTGERYFWNGTTTYWVAGCDEATIERTLFRLAGLGVNRIRAALAGRVENGRAWFEDVRPTENFSFLMGPWTAQRPDNIEAPGYDVTRFNVAHWRRYEKLLERAREKGIVVSVVMYVDGARPGVDPFRRDPGGEDEQRYYRYAVARLAAFSNVMWDVTNEYQLFRDDAWAEKMGRVLKACDPYGHLVSVHGHGDFHFRNSPWTDFAMFQSWDEWGGHDFMLNNRKRQAATGRFMPQVNEEYGYEDHYPVGWGQNRKHPARCADNRRRLAWGMYMAGGYQTTGERATPMGGWINGAGDGSMTMLRGYARIARFFREFEWWKADPHDELVSPGAWCLAEPGKTYAVYLPSGGGVKVKLEPGLYKVRWYDPATGKWNPLGFAAGPEWSLPGVPAGSDRAFLLEKVE
jgi:hypothetical protein